MMVTAASSSNTISDVSGREHAHKMMRTVCLPKCLNRWGNGLNQSTQGNPNPDLRLRIQKGYLNTALRILHSAWPTVVSDAKISIGSHEDDITNVLRQQMVIVKRGMTPKPRMRFDRESQSDVVDDGTELGLIDIFVTYKNWDEEVYLAIECKRIGSDTNDLARLYVREGVFRFASGKYSNGHGVAGMVGYVICGGRDRCIERVASQLDKEPQNQSGFDSDFGWRESKDWVDGETQYLSQHEQLQSKNRILLVHSFLNLN